MINQVNIICPLLFLDFTRDMMSVFTSDVTHPSIVYINEKENAIAPKVTEKGANAVQQQVNDTFIETVSKTALEAIQLVSNAADDEDDQELADKLSKTLNQVAFDLSSAANTPRCSPLPI
ncbi:MAG: YhgE/Pip domain-containing protein [Lachnospiraceae bacterium]